MRAFGFRWARVDAQQSSIETMTAMMDDCLVVGLQPLPIVYDRERLAHVPAPGAVEWGNEPDGDILPSVYREQLDLACALAFDRGLQLWAPAISNLDRDSLAWLALVRADGWPAGLHGISVHRYGDGSFDHPHDGFTSRADEVRRLKELCDGRPLICTEFGYPTKGAAGSLAKRTKYLRAGFHLSEDLQAANIAKEWAFWSEQGFEAAYLYQINDGPALDEGYGIRRYPTDPSVWKLAAYEVPKADDGTGVVMMSATFCISRAASFEMPGRPGEFHTYYPKGQTATVLSVREDGHYEPVDAAGAGAFETWKPSADGNRAVFYETAAIFAIPLVD